MTSRPLLRLALSALALVATTHVAHAACVNRFVARTERPHQIVTLLTGKLTFQEAQALTEAIRKKEAPPLEWVDDAGKTLAKQFGDLKVVRPMPVGCDGKTSGVVVIVSFPTATTPTKKMNVKLNPTTTVSFDQQSE
ncbi:MAG TPA: hypothetical protein VJZ00_22035 [Thermoanaerobaculia bacterium]|nr:hypothetical protein [Thermoanaerobaculia bacterium]